MWKESPEAYNGEKPYIFMSYSHEDSEKVLSVIRLLQNEGYRIWYDEGICVGTEWTDSVAEHLHNCRTVVFFVSASSVKSKNCLDELAYAKKDGKTVVLIHLEAGVEMPRGMEMQTSRYQHLFYYRIHSEDVFVKRISQAPGLDECIEKEASAGDAVTIRTEDDNKDTDKITDKKTDKKARKKSGKRAAAFVLAAIVVLIAVSAIIWRPVEPDISGEEKTTDERENPLYGEVVDKLDALTLLSGTITVEGESYELPAAVSDFTENGWRVKDDTGVLFTTETKFIYLEKDGKELHCEVAGVPEAMMNVINNCRVISVTDYNHSETDVRILDWLYAGQPTQRAADIMVNSFSDEVEAEEISENEFLLKYYDQNTGMTLRVCFDKEKDEVKSVYFKKTKTVERETPKFKGVG